MRYYLLFLFLLNSCTHKMSHTKHGIVFFGNSPGEYVVSDQKFSSIACNKIFIFIPYSMEMFESDLKHQKDLKKHNAVGVAFAEMEEIATYNFFKATWCQTLSGQLMFNKNEIGSTDNNPN